MSKNSNATGPTQYITPAAGRNQVEAVHNSFDRPAILIYRELNSAYNRVAFDGTLRIMIDMEAAVNAGTENV